MRAVRPRVNNTFYSDLGDRWFEDDGHAIALLRAEATIKTEYVRALMRRQGMPRSARVLDVACGAGLVSAPLARDGARVIGIDLAAGAIKAAQRRAPATATYRVGDAYALDEAAASVDVVLLMDMLEHVERPADVLCEASRVARPGGLVVFHTFNQTPAAWLFAIHGLQCVAREVPQHLHVYDRFISPTDLTRMSRAVGIEVREVQGVRPVLDGAFWRSVRRRRVDPAFRFTTTRSKAVGYMGYGVAKPSR